MIRWSVVLPVFNEAGFLPRTLGSLVAQTDRPRLIIVDNASTDDGIAAARRQLAEADTDVLFLSEATPGQVHALRRGIAAVETPLVAICDADTWYPPHYLAHAGRLFDGHGAGCVALGAHLRPEGAGAFHRAAARFHRLTAARAMPRQNHTSGAAQCFRTASLHAAGGYDPAIWPYVLKDHELMHRVLRHGFQKYDADLWCISSGRRRDRRGVRWTLAERLTYHLTPFDAKDAFFRRLGQRFEARGQRDTVLRQRAWENPAPEATA